MAIHGRFGEAKMEKPNLLLYLVPSYRLQTGHVTSKNVCSLGFIGKECVFMQDNAQAHTAGIINGYLSEVSIAVTGWPARNPDGIHP